jgi:hypothetical protein
MHAQSSIINSQKVEVAQNVHHLMEEEMWNMHTM